MALTITIPGAVSTTTGSTAPAILTVGVGAPGQGVPAGGTSGQVLQKLSGVSYDTGWLTLPADFITSVTAPLAVASGVLSVDLSAYSTTAQAAALYYPLSGNPSGFLTASALTGYATESFVTSQGYITSAALTPYITSATATASFYPLSGNPSAFLVAADITGKANLASPTFTGVPLSTTAAVDTNTTQIATTAYVVGNGYAKLASPTFTGTPTLPTGTIATTQTALDSSTKIATTAFVTTAGNLKANLASPTFTGTPTLPTGSIGVTQSPGNNTTALATTAFVTAAVPAFATFAQSQQLTSTTTVMSPFDTITAMMAEGYRPALIFTTATSGAGAGANNTTLAYLQLNTPTAGVAGYAKAVTNNYSAFSTPSTAVTLKFNKPIWISGIYDAGNSSWQGDTNTENKAYLGVTMTNGDDPTGAAIGWFKLGGASTPFQLMVHDGTTLTKVASATSTANSDATFRWMVHSDGAGNVTLYINGVSVATTALGPTSAQANIAQFTAAVKASAAAATRMIQDIYYPKIYVAPQ